MSASDPRSQEDEAKLLLDQARAVRDWTPGHRAQVQRAIEERLRTKAELPRMRIFALAAVSAVFVVFVTWSTRHDDHPHAPSALAESDARTFPIAGGRGHLVLGPGAVGRDGAGEVALRLDRGEADLSLEGVAEPVVIDTPFGRVVSLGARARIEVTASLVAVRVFSGTARMTAGGKTIDVPAGRSMRSDDEAFAASDLEAQNALYRDGLRYRDELHDGQRAIDAWREYLHRFPDGALGPEASQAILSTLVSEGRYADAEREAGAYLDRYGEKGDRAEEVMLVRANILLDHLGDPRRALAIYQSVQAQTERQEIRMEAARGIERASRSGAP